MATGGDGKPTLNPVLTGLPNVHIVENFDTSQSSYLEEIPYAIATGQKLSQWLSDMVNELALRVEMVSNEDHSVNFILSDKIPSGIPFAMATLSGNVPSGSDADAEGRLYVASIVGHAGIKKRDTVIDSIGTARRFGTLGNVGRVLYGPDISLDEAARRVDKSLVGVYTEMLQVLVVSRQSGLRPGRLISVTLQNAVAVTRWQITDVHHFYTTISYDNEAKLIRGDFAWHPAPPKIRPPVFVSGILDSGKGYPDQKPVTRDTVGRVFVRFPFSPVDTTIEQITQQVADTDQDGIVTLSDFTTEEVKEYTDNEADWEEKLEAYDNGDYDITESEYAGYTEVIDAMQKVLDEAKENDEELTKEIIDKNLAKYLPDISVESIEAYNTTQQKIESRNNVLKYKGYKNAKVFDSQDTDQDDYLTDRDQIISDDLSDALRDKEKQASLVDRWKTIKESKEKDTRTDEEKEHKKLELNQLINNEQITEAERETAYNELEEILAREYGVLFDKEYSNYFDDATNDEIDARKDAELEPQRWPARIPLTVIEPMAGKSHGFITSHRQGDICRVAVYSPLWAEIVGFQYRQSQRINAYVLEAEAGMVVEHNHSNNLSGFVFQRIQSEIEETILVGPPTSYAGTKAAQNSGYVNEISGIRGSALVGRIGIRVGRWFWF